VLLAVTVATADALLDALWIPWKVEVHHQRTELQIDALRGGLGGNEDGGFVPEVLHDGCFHVDGAGAGEAVGSLVLVPPLPVNLCVMRLLVRPVDRGSLPFVAIGVQ